MKDTDLSTNQTTIWAFWTLTSIVGWAASHSALQVPGVHAAREVMPLVIAVGLDGLLIGTIIGAGQWFILQQTIQLSSGWLPVTTVLYAVGVPIGLLASALSGLAALEQLGGEVLILSPAKTLLVAGAIISLGQLVILRFYIPRNMRSAALWIMGTIAGFGLGGLFGGTPFGLVELTMLPQSVRDILGGAFTGLISGAVTGGILLLLIKQQGKSFRARKAQAA